MTERYRGQPAIKDVEVAATTVIGGSCFAAAVLAVVFSTCSVARAQSAAQFLQQGPKLVAIEAAVTPYFGSSVAISADGNTALVGGQNDNYGVGAAWVWTKSGGVWTRQGSKLVGSGAVGWAYQGWSVALSADGNTALVGGPGDNSGVGAAWVWTRIGGVWIQQSPKLVGWDVVGNARQGSSVAISADGNTLIVGGPADNVHGAAWVWTRRGDAWTQQGPKLSNGTYSQFGFSVALSADGNTALVGQPPFGSSTIGWPVPGAAWVWTRSGAGIWTEWRGLLAVLPPGSAGPYLGASVALSADGNTALVGGRVRNSVMVWVRVGDDWSFQSGGLGSNLEGFRDDGWPIALSADGNTALIGVPEEGVAGSTWVWNRNGAIWTQRDAKLIGSDAVSGADQGSAVALSADGHTALVGAPGDNDQQVAAWVFTLVAPGDFDGDRRSDRTVFRPSTGAWYSLLSGGGATETFWGSTTDVDVQADYDGDGKADAATWSPSTGIWHIIYSSDRSVHETYWGASNDVPLAGDVNGDRKADLIIWRPSTGSWFVRESTGGIRIANWGISGDQPLLADFDGDGREDLTIYRPTDGMWFVSFAAGGYGAFQWGVWDDVPVTGDWDGDGRADAGIFRQNTGEWFINKSSGGARVVNWGIPGDIPVGWDVDGDGRSDFTIWRPSDGIWFTQFAAGGTAVVYWGTIGDRPVGRQPGS